MDSCTHPAGSQQRIETYRRRVELGLPIFNDLDAKDVSLKVIDRPWQVRGRKQKRVQAEPVELAAQA